MDFRKFQFKNFIAHQSKDSDLWLYRHPSLLDVLLSAVFLFFRELEKAHFYIFPSLFTVSSMALVFLVFWVDILPGAVLLKVRCWWLPVPPRALLNIQLICGFPFLKVDTTINENNDCFDSTVKKNRDSFNDDVLRNISTHHIFVQITQDDNTFFFRFNLYVVHISLSIPIRWHSLNWFTFFLSSCCWCCCCKMILPAKRTSCTS